METAVADRLIVESDKLAMEIKYAAVSVPAFASTCCIRSVDGFADSIIAPSSG